MKQSSVSEKQQRYSLLGLKRWQCGTTRGKGDKPQLSINNVWGLKASMTKSREANKQTH